MYINFNLLISCSILWTDLYVNMYTSIHLIGWGNLMPDVSECATHIWMFCLFSFLSFFFSKSLIIGYLDCPCFCLFFKRFYLFVFRERGREGEREGKKHQCVRETSINYLLYVPQPGTEPTTQACGLTGNRTSDLLLCRTIPN